MWFHSPYLILQNVVRSKSFPPVLQSLLCLLQPVLESPSMSSAYIMEKSEKVLLSEISAFALVDILNARPASRIRIIDRAVCSLSRVIESCALATECVICLAEFVGGEDVRVLPSCNHGFHMECVDTWLRSHSSCPTCRLCVHSDGSNHVEATKLYVREAQTLHQPTASQESGAIIDLEFGVNR